MINNTNRSPDRTKSFKKSLKIPKGGNQNLSIEEEQTIQQKKDERTNSDPKH